MVREAIGQAETILLAQEKACKVLGVKNDEVEFEVLQMPIKKTLGLFGGKLAKVRAYIPNSPEKAAESYIKNILNHLGFDSYSFNMEKKDDGVDFFIDGDDMGKIIGHRGELLNAVQYLSGLVANNNLDDGDFFKVHLNVGSYREKRKKTLEVLAVKTANKSLKYKRNFSLEPMNSYERSIIHMAVQGVEGASSWSVGEDRKRHVIIGSKSFEKNAAIRRNRPGNKNNHYPKINQKDKFEGAPLYGKIK